ncbi:unnamed protein product [Sphagnum jensenii]
MEAEDELRVAQRWTRYENLVLANALRAREEEARDVATKSSVGMASDKWERVANFCRRQGVMRTAAQCHGRWRKGLLPDYRRVREWQRKNHENGRGPTAESSSSSSYWKMKEKQRRECKLPISMDEELYKVLFTFMEPELKITTGSPESEVDSGRHAAIIALDPKDSREAQCPPLDSTQLPAAAPDIGTCSAEDMGQNSTLQKRKRLSSGLVAPEAIVTVDTSRIPMGILVTVPHSLNSTQGYNDGAAAVRPEMSSCLEIAQMAMSSHRETDKSSCLKSDGDKSRRSALEAHLVEQKEALRMQEKLVSDQVIQLVEKSNARLQGQLQALFAQMHMQVQVVSAQMQAQVHEATQSVQAELQTLLQKHSDQVHSYLGSCYTPAQSQFAGHCPDVDMHAPKRGSIGATSSQPLRDDLAQSGPSSCTPRQASSERDRHVRQRQGDHHAEAFPTHLRSQLPAAEQVMDRILAPPQLVPSSAPIWTQAQFVISELDRVLGHQRPANLPVISPPSKCTYSLSEPHRSLRQEPLQKQKTSGPHADLPSGGVKALEAQVSSDPDRVTNSEEELGVSSGKTTSHQTSGEPEDRRS